MGRGGAVRTTRFAGVGAAGAERGGEPGAGSSRAWMKARTVLIGTIRRGTRTTGASDPSRMRS